MNLRSVITIIHKEEKMIILATIVTTNVRKGIKRMNGMNLK